VLCAMPMRHDLITEMRMKFRLAAFLAILTATLPCWALERWQTLPPTPAPIAGEKSGFAKVNGINLYYATIGMGRPVVLLHGGLANSDYWGNQVRALAPHHQVIVVDSRGHGRSGRNQAPFGYDLMTDDVVALLDSLHIQKVDIVGWSDGAIIGIDMALRHRDRVGKVFAFGANTNLDGLNFDVEKNPNFSAFVHRAQGEYLRLSPTPDKYADFHAQIAQMWDHQPSWTDSQLRSITTPIWIADGEHDEGIRLAHTVYMAQTIPHAHLLIFPDASHFAFLQDPALFDAALIEFLDASP
jgi:pimeloyl-ACP methyl ester carboxylesterase